MTRHRKDRPALIVAFIGRYTAERGVPPSVREIAEGVGLASTSSTHAALMQLVKRGVLRHVFGKGFALAPAQITASAIEMAWCEHTHGSRPPKVRPCRRHRLMAEWLAEIVLPRARAIAAVEAAA